MSNLDHDNRFSPEDAPAQLDGAASPIVNAATDKTVNPEDEILGDDTLARNNAVGETPVLDPTLVKRRPALRKQIERALSHN